MRNETDDEESSPLEQELATFAVGEREAKESYTFAEETIVEYERLGIASRHRPEIGAVHSQIFPGMKSGQYYDGRMPPVLKNLSLDEVSAILSLSCNWHGYIAAQFAKVSAKRSEAKTRKEAIWSIVRNNYRKMGKKRGVKFSDQKLSDFARQDKRFISVSADYERLNVLHGCLDALVDVTKKELDTISREVTIRQAKAEAEARSRGISRRGGDQHSAGLPPERRGLVDPAKDRTPRKVIKKRGKLRSPRGS